MVTPRTLGLALLLGLALVACTRGTRTTPTLAPVRPVTDPVRSPPTGPIAAEGLIQRRGFTSYQYGTHLLLDTAGRTLFALRATGLDLDAYVDRPIHLTGNPVPGYPLAGGPPLLDVTDIRVTSP